MDRSSFPVLVFLFLFLFRHVHTAVARHVLGDSKFLERSLKCSWWSKALTSSVQLWARLLLRC
jgi:hypothetical protein